MSRNPIMIPNANKPSLVTAETTIVGHLASVLGKISLPINGETMTTAQLVALYQSHLDAISKIDSLRAQLTAAIKAEVEVRATAKGATICLRNYVAALYGDASTQYSSLGFAARKEPQKTAESKALAVKKLLATRAARHTMGKVQKAKITGNVPEAPAAPVSAPVTVTSVPSSAPAVTAAPAASMPSTAASAVPSNGVASGH
jgi:hypothetical protein